MLQRGCCRTHRGNPLIERHVQLKLFRVKGLFEEFDHEIPFMVSDRVTALIGPNGLGKTVCLRLINALFRKQWSVFSTTQFSEILFSFTDGSEVVVKHTQPSESEVSDALGVTFTTRIGHDGPTEEWSPRTVEELPLRVSRIEQYLPFLTRSGPRLWTHDLTRQAYSLQEVVETFGDQLPEHITSSVSAPPPEALASLISQIDCHLIETQRLLVLQADEYRRSSNSTLAISRKAQTLKSIIAKELAAYAAISQSLDRSFPRRVLQQGPIEPRSGLTSALSDLDNLRRGLTEAGILDPEAEDALPQIDQTQEAIAVVLSVYVEDTRKKLDVLAKLRERILLFKELIDGRFHPKYVVVEKGVGFSVRRSNHIDVPLENLSSGEQHQLVLFFELLFELKTNSLILIDEPELSLHVAWQKQFISDLKRIIGLNEFDVLLATHSPQLIGEWEDLVVELGDVE